MSERPVTPPGNAAGLRAGTPPENPRDLEARREAVRALHRARPRSRLARTSAAVLGLGALAAWTLGDLRLHELLDPRRRANLERFWTRDLVPAPLRGEPLELSGLLAWAGDVWHARGAEATLATLGLAVAAIVLSAALGLVLAGPAARTLAARSPVSLEPVPRGAGWRALSGATRIACVLLRALPEYVWAFLLVALLPHGAWPVVLALAIHNGGILGRLFADTAENVSPRPLQALRGAGASRGALYLFGVLPLAAPRLVSYGLYRFESCVREATVLGMLGVVSIGYRVLEARARQDHGEVLLLTLCGAALVLAADVLSSLARRALRDA